MIPRRHPSSSLLTDFAAGRLSRAPGVTIEAHLEGCAQCAAEVEALEEIEGHGLAAIYPAPLADGALANMMVRIEQQPDLVGMKQSNSRLGDLQIPQAAEHAGVGSRRWLAPGLWVAPLMVAPVDSWRTFLLRAPARTKIPSHAHRGGELIAVLSGSIHDGETYAAGDFAQKQQDIDHRLAVTSDGPCACLISVEGGIVWRGWAKILAGPTGI